ncbi:ribonuclease HI [Thermotomaculum hydrothermale]|uniref:Ribonuclease H n=1 Tax=Thermotomaculum hydrothermale TaxID=981385 RepID=A0A7R6PFY8_9BACT|nr:ribonuclease HI [Thermotomaculum hydrothermale]BBB33019.1 ribonuclease HI [Thermotomaculum hydrothermale]
MSLENKILIYTDGACSGNPGPGGFAAILLYKDREKIISGFEKETTNNRMELKAVIEGLKAIKNKNLPVVVYTDSIYVQKGLTEWIENWKKRGWKKVKNTDLWKELDLIVNQFKNIEFKHIKGHSGEKYNELADKIARNEIRKNQSL